MKNRNLISFVAITIMVSLTTISCKKDRIEPAEEELKEYHDINSYLDSKKQEEQEFVITGPSNDTITGNQGTKIIGAGKNCLRDMNGDTIDYPYSIFLVELFTPADMIYWQMPTVASGNILETDGEIRIRATKNNQDLSLVCPFTFWMPNSAPNSNMTIYTGVASGNFVNWINTANSFNIIPYGYEGTSTKFGWINAGLQVGTGSGHTLTFTSAVDDLTNVGIFIYFTGIDGLMQVYNKTSGLIPNGSSVKIVMMAQNSSGQLFSYTETRTVSSSATIDVSLSQTTDAILTTYLNSL
ncbi:MAG: hypothetical protein HND54_04620 [Bacteroidetes bacterium]|nr:hypothetical protein [Bacteroidota bacterium]